MNYLDHAHDVNRFLEDNNITEKVTLVGHSIGGKVAMEFALLFPEKVNGICSIDSPPVNRNDFPYLNNSTHALIDQAYSYLPEIEIKTYKEAYQWLGSKLYENKVLISSLMMNLDKNSV